MAMRWNDGDLENEGKLYVRVGFGLFYFERVSFSFFNFVLPSSAGRIFRFLGARTHGVRCIENRVISA